MIEVIGDEELMAKFDAANAALKASQSEWLAEAGQIVESSIEEQITAMGLIDTGDLIGSGRVFMLTANGVTVGFGQGLDYGPALELGSEPHEIHATNVENLSFFWEREGVQFYGPVVWHPGNRPYRFMRNGSEMAMPLLMAMFARRLSVIFGVPL